jgi:hypothetical protein
MQPLAPARWKVLGIRVVLGMFLAVLLTRFFVPRAGLVAVLAAAVLLVSFAYLFESVRQR